MIYTASIVGFARTLLIILAVYFIVKILSRLFMPYMLRFVAKKAEQRFGQQFEAYGRNPQQKQRQDVGETVIDKMPNNNKSSNKDVGEYIDYEEID